MLRLICAEAAPVMRRLLTESFVHAGGADGTLFVVPTEEIATAHVAAWSRAADLIDPNLILAFDDLTTRIRKSHAGYVIQPAERLAILRQILLSGTGKYDRLVGGATMPHLTHGVLQRIGDAANRVAERDRIAAETGEELAGNQSARVRQLRDLEVEYERRMRSADALDARVLDRQSWAELTTERLSTALPAHQRIVWDGFDALNDLHVLAMRRLRDVGADVLLLLVYDPERDADRFSHLNPVYERLYDVVDQVVLEPPQVEGAGSAAAPAIPHIVTATTRLTEVNSIAQFLRAELDAWKLADPFPFHDYVVAVPALHTYAPLVREAFADFGLPARLDIHLPVLKQPLVVLLDAMRAALTSSGSFETIRELLKSPLLGRLLEVSTGTTIQQVQVLDRLRREEGISSAGKQLVSDIKRVIDQRRRELAAHEERMAGSEDENPRIPQLRAQLDEYVQLAQWVEATLQLVRKLYKSRPLAGWRDYLVQLIDETRTSSASTGCGDGSGLATDEEKHAATCDVVAAAVNRLCECDALLAAEDVDFSRVVGLLRVLLRAETIAEPQPPAGFAVVLPSEAAAHQARVVIVAGMVDTEFPQYLTREARLDDSFAYDLDQKAHISRQRFTFNALCRSAQDRVLLFVPESDNDGELLESQFIEELETENADVQRTRCEEFVAGLSRTSRSASETLDAIAQCLQAGNSASASACDNALAGRRLTVEEHRITENIIYNVCAGNDRTRMDALGNFDGFVYDPVLLKFLQQRTDAHLHSVSQLDVLVQCPFRYFLEYVLGVREPDELEEGTAPRRMGELAHSILYGFYTEWVDTGRGAIDATSRADAGVMLAAHAEAELAKAELTQFERDALAFRLYGSDGPSGLTGGDVKPDDNLLSLVRDYRGLLPAFLDLEVQRTEIAGEQMMKPMYFELGFGLPTRHQQGRDEHSDRNPVELDLPGGEKIRLRGRADRVDVGADAFAIVDYKTGAMPNIAQQKQGFKVQLPVYLMAIEQLFKSRGQHLQAVGGMFVALTPKEATIEGQFFRKGYMAAAGISPRKRGMTDEDYDEALELVKHRIADGLERIRGGRFHVTLAGEKIACGLCNNARICRKDLQRAEQLVPQVCGPGVIA